MQIFFLCVLLLVLCLSLSSAASAHHITLSRDEIVEIRTLLEQQAEKISKLEQDNVLLKIRLTGVEDENKLLKHEVSDLTKKIAHKNLEGDNSLSVDPLLEQTSVDSKQRRLLAPDIDSPPTTPLPVEPIAFYAYMSTSEPAPSIHHTLAFDVIKTNFGNGYNKHSGTFIAPVPGVYVFTWTIYTAPHGGHYINLLVNSAVVGGSLIDTGNTDDDDSDSSTVVVSLNKGDSVNLRTTQASYNAVIFADIHAFTCFAGWKL